MVTEGHRNVIDTEGHRNLIVTWSPGLDREWKSTELTGHQNLVIIIITETSWSLELDVNQRSPQLLVTETLVVISI